MSKTVFAKYNRTRAPEFQTKTVVEETGGRLFVRKEALGKQAEAHVISMQEKHGELKNLYKNLKPVEVTIKGKSAVFPFLQGSTISKTLEADFDHKEKLLANIKQHLEITLAYNEEHLQDFVCESAFEELFGHIDYTGKAVRICNLDQIFDNVIISENGAYIIDYEWVFNFPVPVEFINFRTVYYFYSKYHNQLRNRISEEDYLAYFGFDAEKTELWKTLDDKFQQLAHGENRKYIYTNNYAKTTHNVTALMNQYRDIGALVAEKEALIRAKDGNISDYQANEAALNKSIDDYKANEGILNKMIDDYKANEVALNKMINDYKTNEEVLNKIISDRQANEERLTKMVGDYKTNEEVLNKMITDYQSNEETLNTIITDLRNDRQAKEQSIQNLNVEVLRRDEVIEQRDEYIRHLKKCLTNPVYGATRLGKKAVKVVLPQKVKEELKEKNRLGKRMYEFNKKHKDDPTDPYELWLAQKATEEYAEQNLAYTPKISVVVPVYNVESSQLIECIESVRNQTYKNWELCLADDCSTMESVRKTLAKYEKDPKIKIVYREKNGHISKATNSGIEVATGEFIGLLDCDDLLDSHALYAMAEKLNENKDYDFIYSDEDHITEDGTKRMNPFFKPDWSPDTFMSLMYTCHFSIFRKSLVDELGGMRVGYEGSQDYDLVLRVMEKTKNIGHVPRILYHWRERKESTANDMAAKPYILESTVKAKEDALERRGLKGHLEYLKDVVQYRVVYEPDPANKVSIVIPSKDNYKILKQCITTLYENTEYKNFEVAVVDNGSNEDNKKLVQELCDFYGCAYYYDPMDFNFSKMCNIGAQKTTGEYVLFLNDDIEIIQADWLSRMLGQAQVSYTGAVGCKLIYPGGNRIQHTGVVNLRVGPGHAFPGFDDDLNCYYGRNVLDYNYAVVTGACLLMSRKKYDEIGGFDETLPVAYNDVELCFKLLEHGYYNVVRNDVKLIHHESVSRGYDAVNEEKLARLKKEMARLYEMHPTFKEYDPCYNPNLTQTEGDFSFNLENVGVKVKAKKYKGELIEAGFNEYSVDGVSISDKYIRITGWAAAERKSEDVTIILQDEQKTKYAVKTEPLLREDVKKVFNYDSLDALCGFSAKIIRSSLPHGTYEIYLMMNEGKNVCDTGKKFVNSEFA